MSESKNSGELFRRKNDVCFVREIGGPDVSTPGKRMPGWERDHHGLAHDEHRGEIRIIQGSGDQPDVYAAFPERLNLLLASQLTKEYPCRRMLLPKPAQHIDNNGAFAGATTPTTSCPMWPAFTRAATLNACSAWARINRASSVKMRPASVIRPVVSCG